MAPREWGRGVVHGVAQIEGRQIADELAGLLDEVQGVLASIRGERDDVGLVGEGVEEGVGREVYFTLGAHCSDPADWSRGYQSLKRIMRQPVRLGIALVDHASLPCPLANLRACSRPDTASQQVVLLCTGRHPAERTAAAFATSDKLGIFASASSASV